MRASRHATVVLRAENARLTPEAQQRLIDRVRAVLDNAPVAVRHVEVALFEEAWALETLDRHTRLVMRRAGAELARQTRVNGAALAVPELPDE